MPQIPNRDDAEKRLAAVIQRVQLRTREKLVRALGNPPDARNIPESLWLEVERELSRETEALLVLFLIASGGTFTSWLDEHPEYPAARDALYQPEHFADIAARVGRAQSQRLAQQMVATSKQRLADVGQKLNRVTTYSEALRNELESAGRMTPEVREAIKERVSTERGTTARELYDRTVESITSDSRAEIAARTEVTQSTTLGETIVERRWRERTPNLVLIHYWKHRFPGQPGHPCPEICVPLLNTPQNYWPAIHPDMPEVWDGPPGHVNCDCYTEVQIVTLSQAQRVPTMFPVGGKAASLVSKLLAASGQYLSTTSLPRHWPGAAFKTSAVAENCGANTEGGGGFQPGNTCAEGGGNVEAKPRAAKLKQTESLAFERWFKDSKVVDENGNPLVVYHGTAADFTQFETGGNKRRGAVLGYGHYFTSESERASAYSGDGDGANIKPVYLSIQNPMNLDGEITAEQADALGRVLAERAENKEMLASPRQQSPWIDKPAAEALWEEKLAEWKEHGGGVSRTKPRIHANKDVAGERFAIEFTDTTRASVSRNAGEAFRDIAYVMGPDSTGVLQAAGFDGVKRGDEWVAFDATQIKSATGNEGTFDPSSADIRKTTRRKHLGPGDHPNGSPQSAHAHGGGDHAKQTDTPEFRRWFGDSKIVDEDGEPLVVYHASDEPKDEFPAETRRGLHYFSPSEKYTKPYGDAQAFYVKVERPRFVNSRDAASYDLYEDVSASPAKPYDGTVSYWPVDQFPGGREAAVAKGFHVDAESRVWFEVAVENRLAVKSADENEGTFDPSNPDIRKTTTSA